MNSFAYSTTTRLRLRAISPSRDFFWYALAIALAALGSMYAFRLDAVKADMAVRALMVTGGALFGFLITSLSILLAISGREFVKRLRASGHFGNLVDQIFINALALLAGLGCGLIYLLSAHPALPPAVSASVVFALVVFLRIGWKYRVIFHRLD